MNPEDREPFPIEQSYKNLEEILSFIPDSEVGMFEDPNDPMYFPNRSSYQKRYWGLMRAYSEGYFSSLSVPKLWRVAWYDWGRREYLLAPIGIHYLAWTIRWLWVQSLYVPEDPLYSRHIKALEEQIARLLLENHDIYRENAELRKQNRKTYNGLDIN